MPFQGRYPLLELDIGVPMGDIVLWCQVFSSAMFELALFLCETIFTGVIRFVASYLKLKVGRLF